MRRLISFLAYIPLQVAFIPLAILGAGIQTYRQIFVSKRLGASSTGIEIIGGRWTMHLFGIRSDQASARLMRALPNASTAGMWLFLFPLWVKYKLSGSHFVYPRIPAEGHETLADLVIARTLVFDRIIERVVAGVDQFVVLGAGYDARPYGALGRDGLRFFEVDQESTQQVKRDGLQRAEIDSDHVTFVAVDFQNRDWFNGLPESGYDRAKKTLFLWEGVTPYLSEQDVRGTLRVVRENAAPGSTIVADFYADRVVAYANGSFKGKMLDYTGEVWRFGLPLGSDPGALERLVSDEGVSLVDATILGGETKKGAIMEVAELRV